MLLAYWLFNITLFELHDRPKKCFGHGRTHRTAEDGLACLNVIFVFNQTGENFVVCLKYINGFRYLLCIQRSSICIKFIYVLLL